LDALSSNSKRFKMNRVCVSAPCGLGADGMRVGKWPGVEVGWKKADSQDRNEIVTCRFLTSPIEGLLTQEKCPLYLLLLKTEFDTKFEKGQKAVFSASSPFGRVAKTTTLSGNDRGSCHSHPRDE